MIKSRLLVAGRQLSIVLAGLMFSFASPTWADWSFVFNNPTGNLPTTQAYTNNGVTVTAHGYNALNIPTNLYGKNDGGDEIGLGLAFPVGTTDHEIQPGTYIQLDMAQFWAQNPTNVTMSFGSVQQGEGWKIFGSNSLGSIGAFLMSGSANYPTTVGIPGSFGAYQYLGITASTGDILLSTLSGKMRVPEPSTYLILGSTLLLVGLRRRLLRTC